MSVEFYKKCKILSKLRENLEENDGSGLDHDEDSSESSSSSVIPSEEEKEELIVQQE